MRVLKIFSEIFHYPPKNILFSVYGLNIAEKYNLKYAQHTVYVFYEIKYKFYQKKCFCFGRNTDKIRHVFEQTFMVMKQISA